MGGHPSPDFDAVEAALRDAGALAEPSEIHGQLCGLACLMGTDSAPPWVAEALADSQRSDAEKHSAAEVLGKLGQSSLAALDAGDMSLDLLLPDDAAPLELRAESLGHWCRGFLHGLGAAGEADSCASTLLEKETTREIIEDFSEISRAGFAAGETDAEVAENAFAELVEYVRVGAQLFFEELRLVRTAGSGSGPQFPT